MGNRAFRQLSGMARGNEQLINRLSHGLGQLAGAFIGDRLTGLRGPQSGHADPCCFTQLCLCHTGAINGPFKSGRGIKRNRVQVFRFLQLIVKQEAAAELKRIDPDTAITPYFIRTMVLDGTIPHVRAGNKRLINLDTLLEYLATAPAPQPEPVVYGQIRPVKGA